MIGLDGGARPVQTGCLRLVVVSEDETLPQRARGILERDGLVVRVEASGRDLAAAGRFERRPTLVIVRRSTDGVSLGDAVAWARREAEGAGLLVVLPELEADGLADLLTLGVGGVVLERDLEATLAPVVRSLAGGQVSIPGALRHLVRPPGLTHREREVVALALTGLTDAEIARRLVISANTVRSHLTSAFRRLGVRSRRELATRVLVSGDELRRAVRTAPRRRAHDVLEEEGNMHLHRRHARYPVDDLERHLMRARRRQESVEVLTARLRRPPRGMPARLASCFRLTDSVAVRPARGGLVLTALFDAGDFERAGVEHRLRTIAGQQVDIRWARFPEDGLTLPVLLERMEEEELCH
jgi:DNA-binding NarL/FixJ family response regulator